MAHELTIRADGSAEMFYAADADDGGTPWHGLGTPVEGAVTSEEAIVLAQMDWEVALGNVYDQRKRPLKERKVVYRSDNGEVLGIVRPTYRAFQNRDAFEFLDSLVEDRVVKYDTAGTLFGGKRIWLLARIEDDLEINGEHHIPYMLLTSSHDGARALRVLPTMTRVVCNNTLQMALGRGKGSLVRIPHSKRMDTMLDTAKTALRITTSATRELTKLLELSQRFGVTQPQFEAVRTSLFGTLDDETATVRRNAIEKFVEIYGEEAAKNGETAYSAINAITGFADHARNYRGSSEERAESRFEAITEGRSADMKRDGIGAVLAAVPDFAKEARETAHALGLT